MTVFHVKKTVWACSTGLYLYVHAHKIAYLYDLRAIEEIRANGGRTRVPTRLDSVTLVMSHFPRLRYSDPSQSECRSIVSRRGKLTSESSTTSAEGHVGLGNAFLSPRSGRLPLPFPFNLSHSSTSLFHSNLQSLFHCFL